ncbi:hypothetical protein OHA40_26560 [Nocardia sp. NBC_00508]|uniref:hypothetical protein n=1 Tax=Nocardia sp. NBC_00508 TaxID=2975992 RepID=UPI002E810B9A|nr:hypothetical protein [Nocardia sp. NBC_00508]WUD65175.1 hypothetical protein OHA40_26560 [Nocardia sp. NBC_00508]
MYLNGSSAEVELRGRPPAGAVPLLEPGQLFRAISGRAIAASPLAEWARELSDLHAALIPFRCEKSPRPPGIGCRQIRAGIDQIVVDIDVWAARHLPRTGSARMHTHSLGEVIAHIARNYAEAWWTMRHATDEEIRHQAWFHLGEAMEGYSEMVSQIRARHLQLPLGSVGIWTNRPAEPGDRASKDVTRSASS